MIPRAARIALAVSLALMSAAAMAHGIGEIGQISGWLAEISRELGRHGDELGRCRNALVMFAGALCAAALAAGVLRSGA